MYQWSTQPIPVSRTELQQCTKDNPFILRSKTIKMSYKVFITLFTVILQVKTETIPSDSSNDCRTNVRRQIMRKYPRGSALYFDGKCLCGGLMHETINGFVQPHFRSSDETVSGYSEPKLMETRPDNRIFGSYGSLVFSTDVRALNSLNAKRENQYLCCNCVQPSPSSNRILLGKRAKDRFSNETVSETTDGDRTSSGGAEGVEFPSISLDVFAEIGTDVSTINPRNRNGLTSTRSLKQNDYYHKANSSRAIAAGDSERDDRASDSEFGDESTPLQIANDDADVAFFDTSRKSKRFCRRVKENLIEIFVIIENSFF